MVRGEGKLAWTARSRDGGKGKRRGGEGSERGRGEKGRWEGNGVFKVTFWNVAGMENKDKEFWDGLREWDVIVLSETWVDEKGWERVKNKLPKDYGWEAQWAIRERARGRAKGGMIIGAKKGIKVERGECGREIEGILERKVYLGDSWWRVIGVYVNRDLEVKLRALKK